MSRGLTIMFSPKTQGVFLMGSKPYWYRFSADYVNERGFKDFRDQMLRTFYGQERLFTQYQRRLPEDCVMVLSDRQWKDLQDVQT